MAEDGEVEVAVGEAVHEKAEGEAVVAGIAVGEPGDVEAAVWGEGG